MNRNRKGIIYVHINKINGKAYVGQTIQTLQHRWGGGSLYSTCTCFYRAIQKYGWDNFEHKILECGLNDDELNERERYWIEKYNSIQNGYNIREGGNNQHLTEEHKEKIRLSNIKTLGRSVVCLNTGVIYDSETSSKKATGAEHIGDCCSGKIKTAGKDKNGNALLWKYIEDYTGKEEIVIKKQKRAKSKVLCIETNIEYDSAKEAERCTGIDSSSIGRVCNGKRQSAGGYHWQWI
jgi:group I intron endonuclease